jgi:hypothetical protein
MKTIWKFEVGIQVPKFRLDLPMDARVVKVDHGYMWIEGTFNAANGQHVEFQIIGTGHEVPAGFDYAGTYFATPYVWHVYMERQ